MPPLAALPVKDQETPHPTPIRFLSSFGQALEPADLPELIAQSGLGIGNQPFRRRMEPCGFRRFNSLLVNHGAMMPKTALDSHFEVITLPSWPPKRLPRYTANCGRIPVRRPGVSMTRVHACRILRSSVRSPTSRRSLLVDASMRPQPETSRRESPRTIPD